MLFVITSSLHVYNYYGMYTCIGLNYINNVLLGSGLFTLADWIETKVQNELLMEKL